MSEWAVPWELKVPVTLGEGADAGAAAVRTMQRAHLALEGISHRIDAVIVLVVMKSNEPLAVDDAENHAAADHFVRSLLEERLTAAGLPVEQMQTDAVPIQGERD